MSLILHELLHLTEVTIKDRHPIELHLNTATLNRNNLMIPLTHRA